MIRRTTLVVVALVASAAHGLAARAESSACTAGQFRAAARNGSNLSDTDINGVKGIIEIPRPYNFRNVDGGFDFSVADLYGFYGSDFVQFGWNYGYTDDAHGFVAAYYPFMGEASGTSEILQFDYSRPLVAGRSYTFEIRRNETPGHYDYGRFFAFLDGVAILKTTKTHLIGYPASNGEVNKRCHGMWNSVLRVLPDGTYATTLQYHRRSTGAWYPWQQQYDFTNDSCFTASRYGLTGTANDYSNFGSSCPQS
jgi:hypothetical protein